MRLAISNIAWEVTEDQDVAHLLHRYKVDAIDIAPGKYFLDPAKVVRAEIQQVKAWWAERGMAMTGMQALLFGTTGLNVFGPTAVQETMLMHLAAVCRIGAELGAIRLVFGSPKNRDRTGLTDEQADTIAIAFFRQLGDIAAKHGVVVCLEPNPPVYGCNFMITTEETARIVRQVSHPAIRLQLDTGAMAINGEDPKEIILRHQDIIGHIHASEPDLVTLGDGGARHADVASILKAELPDRVVSIEMLAAKTEPHLIAIERALQVATRYYRP
jgi:sugar phosphate isomerase/epimerase